MKLAVILILACAGICAVGSSKGSAWARSWGDLNGKILGTKKIHKTSSLLQKKSVTFTYPSVNFSYLLIEAFVLK